MAERLTNLVLLPEQVQEARSLLEALVAESSADGSLLLLRSGEIAVSHVEEPLGQLDTLGALIAANFASAREIARLLGEPGFDGQFQQGTNRQVVSQAVGEGWILAVLFRQASGLGLVRVLAQRTAEALAPLYRRAAEAVAPRAEPSFKAAAATAIDSLFREPEG